MMDSTQNALLVGLVIGNASFSVLLLLLWLRTRQQNKALKAETAALQKASRAIPADLQALLGDPSKRIITVEILNPMQLATDKTWLAKPVAGMSPGLINRIVYQQARDIVEQQMPKFGAVAVVKVRGA